MIVAVDVQFMPKGKAATRHDRMPYARWSRVIVHVDGATTADLHEAEFTAMDIVTARRNAEMVTARHTEVLAI